MPEDAENRARVILVRRFDLTSYVPVDGGALGPTIEEYAVWKGIILGKLSEGFFIVETDAHEREAEPMFKTYSSVTSWKEALKELGVPEGILLRDPDEAATTRPQHELSPENYVIMKGLLGLSDAMWATLVLALGAILSVLVGVLFSDVLFLVLIPLVLGIVANIAANIVIVCEGGPALAGMVGYPLIYVAISRLALLAKRIIRRKGRRAGR